MNQRVKFRQGTKVQNDAFTGVPGEITVNNDQNTLRVHDNHTPGGTELARSDLTNVSNNDFSAKAAAAGVLSSNNNTTPNIIPDGGTPANTNFQIQMRRGTAKDWAGFNPVLAAGELAVTIDSSPLQMKIGNGVSAWNDLPYMSGSGGPTSASTTDTVFHYTFGTAGGSDTIMGTGSAGSSLIKWNNRITKQNIDYNQATGTFTVTTAGKYYLYSGLQFVTVEGSYFGLLIQKNGATIVENYKGGVTGLTDVGTLRYACDTLNSHITVDLAVNDTLTVYLGWSADVDIDSYLQTGYPNRNYFGGYMVGGGGQGPVGPTGPAGPAGSGGSGGSGNYQTPGSPARSVSRPFIDKMSDFLSVMDFGAKGDGVANDQAAIQAAIDYAGSQSGGTVYMPSGVYKIDSGLSWSHNGVYLRGDGEGVTVLKATFHGDIIRIAGSGAGNSGDPGTARNGGVSRMRIISTINRSTGSAIYTEHCHNIVMEYLRFDGYPLNTVGQPDGGGNLNIAVTMNGGLQYNTYLKDFEINGCNTGIVVGSNNLFPQNIHISNGEIFGAKNDGVFVHYVSGLDAFNVGCTACGGSGWVFLADGSVTGRDPVSSIRWVTLNMCGADTNNYHGFNFTSTNGGFISGIRMVASWSSSNGQDKKAFWTGVALNEFTPGSKTENILIDSTQMVNNTANAVMLLSGNHFTINNCLIEDNSTWQPGVYGGIYVGPNMNNFAITNNQVGTVGSAGWAGQAIKESQSYGIDIGKNCDNYVITGNVLRGNQKGGININGSAGAESYIANNVGGKPYNK
jgi:hypothetical protein